MASLVPNTDQFTQNLLGMLMNNQQTDRQDQLLKNKLSREQDLKKMEIAGAQALELRNLPDLTQKRTGLLRLAQNAISTGGDPTAWEKIANIEDEDEMNLALRQMAVGSGILTKKLQGGTDSAGQREFESLTSGLSGEDAEKARRIKVGLDPRAVGSADITIAEDDLTDIVADSQAVIKQRTKFAEATGASRAKMIDKGFNRITKINQGIGSIDRAIKALEGGAKTGAVQRFFPSIRSASVELNQIRNQLALDVINSVTLGALSEKELELTKETALPTGLDEPQLIKHLQDRKAAQEKLRTYFEEQIDFLDKGGTVAGFLREKKRAQVEPEQAETQEVNQDDEALAWARANPNDPRAAEIMRLQGQ